MIVGEHGEYDVCTGGFGRVAGGAGALLEKEPGFFGRAIIYGKVVSGLEQVHRHCRAHVSKTNESDFHKFAPVIQLAIVDADEMMSDSESVPKIRVHHFWMISAPLSVATSLFVAARPMDTYKLDSLDLLL
jgi:hypothetical protein